MTTTGRDWGFLPPSRSAPPAQVIDLLDGDDFNSLAERQAARCRRQGEILSALTLEVLFESASEPDDALHQHLLADCARRLRSRVRASDLVACWQVTHFGVLLPRCEPQHAEAVLVRLTRFGSGSYRLGNMLLNLQLQGRVLSSGGRSADSRRTQT